MGKKAKGETERELNFPKFFQDDDEEDEDEDDSGLLYVGLQKEFMGHKPSYFASECPNTVVDGHVGNMP